MSEPGSQSLQDVGKGLFLGSHLLIVLAGLFSPHRLASFNEIFSFARMRGATATSAIPLSLFSVHFYEASLHIPHLKSTFPRQTWQDFAYTVESVKAEFTEAEGRMVVTRIWEVGGMERCWPKGTEVQCCGMNKFSRSNARHGDRS